MSSKKGNEGAGGYRHLLSFIKDVGTETDTVGAHIEVWQVDFKQKGAFEPLGSREFPTAWKRYAETTARFRIRHRASADGVPAIDPALHRIRLTLDGVTTDWNISPPITVDGKLFKVNIEASEVK